LGLFFGGWPSTADSTDAADRAGGQGCRQFVASPANRFLVETSNLGDARVAAIPEPGGFHGSDPAPLRFVEPAHEQVQLLMEQPIRMLLVALAVRTATGGNRTRHGSFSGVAVTASGSFYLLHPDRSFDLHREVIL
jgi:hypothetical protein